jgi:hypothetical protein
VTTDDAQKGDAKPVGDPKAGDAKPGDAKPGDAKPGDAKAGDAKPGDKAGGEAGDPKAEPKKDKPAAQGGTPGTLETGQVIDEKKDAKPKAPPKPTADGKAFGEALTKSARFEGFAKGECAILVDPKKPFVANKSFTTMIVGRMPDGALFLGPCTVTPLKKTANGWSIRISGGSPIYDGEGRKISTTKNGVVEVEGVK